MKPRLKIFFVLMVVLAIMLSACTNSNLSKSDRIVPVAKRIELLNGGPHQDMWKTKHLSMNYEYQREAAHLVISGKIKMAEVKTLLDFKLNAHFLNANGQVIFSQNIISAGRYQKINELPFRMDLNMPEGTWGVAFSYAGTFYDGLWGSDLDRKFWHIPF